jgi:hypothetical protein
MKKKKLNKNKNKNKIYPDVSLIHSAVHYAMTGNKVSFPKYFDKFPDEIKVKILMYLFS